MERVDYLEKTLRKSWPKGLPQSLVYKQGEMPLHDYLVQNAKENPNRVAYVYYGNDITWGQMNDETNRLLK